MCFKCIKFHAKINFQDISFKCNENEKIMKESKNELMKTIKRVFKAKLHCIFLIDKTFGSISPNTQTSNQNDMFV